MCFEHLVGKDIIIFVKGKKKITFYFILFYSKVYWIFLPKSLSWLDPHMDSLGYGYCLDFVFVFLFLGFCAPLLSSFFYHPNKSKRFYQKERHQIPTHFIHRPTLSSGLENSWRYNSIKSSHLPGYFEPFCNFSIFSYRHKHVFYFPKKNSLRLKSH